MLHTYRHYLLALLMILQSVSSAWAQMYVIDTAPAVTEAMQPGEHCAMMAKNSANASEQHAVAASKAKSKCPCCKQQCEHMNCAAMHLQVLLSVFNTCIQPAPSVFISTQFSQIVDTHYLRPPTPPPNALQS